jgi:hypothetical protein
MVQLPEPVLVAVRNRVHMNVEIINPIEGPAWDERIRAHPDATIFHTSSWARVLSEAFGYQPFYFCHINEKGFPTCLPVMEINSALLGHKGKTLPFTDYCSPLVGDGSKALEMVGHVVDFGRSRGWKSYELRGGAGMLESTPAFNTCYGHTISLQEGADKVFKKFRNSTKRNVKHAIEKGVQVEHHDSLESMKAYYRLHCLTRKRQGNVIRPFVLYQKIYENIIAKGQGFVSLASAERKLLAGAIYFHVNRRAFFAFGASDSASLHLRPNNALMWDAIQWYAQRGFQELSLGVTDGDNAGLRQYKNGMATSEKTLHYYRYHYPQAAFIAEKRSSLKDLRISVCKKMPVPVLKTIGDLLYKHHG